MISLTINGLPVQVPAGTTILEAARLVKVDIPILCKHPDLPATASCGICVVKISKAGNLVRACATPVSEGMQVETHDPEIIAVRRTVLEMILAAHPNECLTCGRNRSCELQRLAENFGIRRASFPSLVPDLPIDDSTKSIVLEPRKCIKCGRCLQVCQNQQDVWALSFLQRGIHTRISPAGEIHLADSPCVRCGQCSAHCPVGAIYEHDDTGQVWESLRNPDLHCVAQIAPAVRVSIGEAFGHPPGTLATGQLYHVLRRMGFKTVFDTNFGADVTVMEEGSELIHRLTHEPQRLPLITSCCPAWVDFMEKYHGDMIDHFSTCKSPHALLGTLAKTYYAKKIGLDPARMRVISIMPCTAKKFEIGRNPSMAASGQQDVDISLTTRELVRMIRQAGFRFAELPCLEEADSPLGPYSGAGTIFGMTGGVMEAALRTAHFLLTGQDQTDLEARDLYGLEGVKVREVVVAGRPLRIAIAHGLSHVEQVIDLVRQAKAANREPPYHFVEVMACPGGCVGGGGQAWHVDDCLRQQRAEGLQKDDRIHQVRFSHRNPGVNQLYQDFLGQPLSEQAHHLLHTSYTKREQYRR